MAPYLVHHALDESVNAYSISALLRTGRELQAKSSEAHAEAHDWSGGASTNLRWEISVDMFLGNTVALTALIVLCFGLAPSLARLAKINSKTGRNRPMYQPDK